MHTTVVSPSSPANVGQRAIPEPIKATWEILGVLEVIHNTRSFLAAQCQNLRLSVLNLIQKIRGALARAA